MKLMDDCRAGKVDLILTKSISRFARDTVTCLKYLRMLMNLPKPVYVYFEKENINTEDNKSEFMVTIYGSLAQEESMNMGAAISWGIRKYAERGIIRACFSCYGYECDRQGQWVIKDEEARIVKRIYKELLEGKTYYQIIKELNKDKISSPEGKEKWPATTVIGILKSEVYRGNYLFQKYYVKETIGGKVARNDGDLPKYLIENHHEAIISSSDWENVQSLLEQRSETHANKSRIKYSEDKMKNKAFDKKLICGECGTLISHRRYIQPGLTNNQEIHYWICNDANNSSAADRCQAKKLNQEYIEYNFYCLLRGIKNSRNFIIEMEEMISKIELNQEELGIETEIHNRIDTLNQKLYETVDEELNKKGRDSRKVDELTDEIVKLQSQLKANSNRKEKAHHYRQELKWLLDELEGISEATVPKLKNNSREKVAYCIGTINNYIEKIKQRHIESSEDNKSAYQDEEISYYSDSINFRKDIFNRIVDSCKIFKDGRIVFKLKFGIEWSTDLNYEKYKKILHDLRISELEAKRKDILRSPAVNDLLKFCEEPKTIHEIFSAMNKIMFISKSHLRAVIINPLLEEGKLKRTFPDDQYNKKQRYYSVK